MIKKKATPVRKERSKYRIIENRHSIKYVATSDINLHIIGDVHYGSNAHDNELFEHAISMIAADPKARVIFNGDMLEYIPDNYKISNRGQSRSCDDQIIEFVDLIAPIKDKIIAMIRGNHEFRALNHGLDVTKIMCKMLEVPYYPVGGFVKFVIKENGRRVEFLGAIGHGKSGAANADLELNKQRALYGGADFYALGHNHKLYAKPVDQLVFKDSETLQEVWYIRTGSFLKLAEYAREALYSIVRTGWIEVKMGSDGKLNCIKHDKSS